MKNGESIKWAFVPGVSLAPNNGNTVHQVISLMSLLKHRFLHVYKYLLG